MRLFSLKNTLAQGCCFHWWIIGFGNTSKQPAGKVSLIFSKKIDGFLVRPQCALLWPIAIKSRYHCSKGAPGLARSFCVVCAQFQWALYRPRQNEFFASWKLHSPLTVFKSSHWLKKSTGWAAKICGPAYKKGQRRRVNMWQKRPKTLRFKAKVGEGRI